MFDLSGQQVLNPWCRVSLYSWFLFSWSGNSLLCCIYPSYLMVLSQLHGLGLCRMEWEVVCEWSRKGRGNRCSRNISRSGLLGFSTVSIVWYSKTHKRTQCFGNCNCFRNLMLFSVFQNARGWTESKKSSNPECYTPSSEPSRNCHISRYSPSICLEGLKKITRNSRGN
jgi:hypothetical protein